MNWPNRQGVCLHGSLVDIRSMDSHHHNVLKLHVFLEEFNPQEIFLGIVCGFSTFLETPDNDVISLQPVFQVRHLLIN